MSGERRAPRVSLADYELIVTSRSFRSKNEPHTTCSRNRQEATPLRARNAPPRERIPQACIISLVTLTPGNPPTCTMLNTRKAGFW